MPVTKKTKKAKAPTPNTTTTNSQMQESAKLSAKLSVALDMNKKLRVEYQHLAELADAVLSSEIDFQGITKRGTRKWFRKNPSRRLSPQKGQAKKKEDYVPSASEIAIAALKEAIQNTPAVKAKRKAARVAKAKAAYEAAMAEE